MSVLQLKNINKVFENGVAAVRDFNLEIHDKEFVIFVGPSGCGKSTTLRMIAGLEEISSGELWLENNLINFVETKERDFSMVFQNYALYPYMSVFENIAFSLRVRKYPKKEIEERVKNVAKMLKIEELLFQKPSALSGGQKQRVAIGSAIVRNSKLFLMDEPLSNLDAKLRTHMRVELAKLHKELNTTIVYVTHDQTEAMTLGTKIVVMKDGIIQQVAKPSTLYNKPINKFVAGFIGIPTMNFIEADIVSYNRKIYLEIDEWKIELNNSLGEQLYAKGYLNESVIVGIRPEDINLVEDRVFDFNDSTVISVIPHMREVLGAESNIYFDLANITFCISCIATCEVQLNQRLDIRFRQEKIHFFDSKSEENILFLEGE
jgi:multiple sugar transport system ATP-binding protein